VALLLYQGIGIHCPSTKQCRFCETSTVFSYAVNFSANLKVVVPVPTVDKDRDGNSRVWRSRRPTFWLRGHSKMLWININYLGSD